MTEPLRVVTPAEAGDATLEEEVEARIAALLKRYPTKQAALLPILWLCQERQGWISPATERAVAARLDLSPAFVEGVLTFYTMYRRQPPGKYVLQVCTTLSCQLCGTSDLVRHLKSRLGVDFGETTADGRFTLVDVQCLGACGSSPVVQVNDDYHVNLTVEELDRLLDGLE
jgi:NADH-quinone oxidoreductase E subunit